MFKNISITCLLSILLLNVKAQDCSVMVDSLKGKYEGECKNGLADGKGKAEGTDMYEGEFKAGLPDGDGKYVWKNGNWYDGHWRKGKREGQGQMFYKLDDNRDSLVNGFWKKDAYAGKYEKPYIIHYKTLHVTRLSVTFQNKLLNQVELSLSSVSGNSPYGASRPGEMVPKPELTDMTVNAGTYNIKRQKDTYAKKTEYILEEVVFPFRVVFTFGNDSVDLEFLEAGKWIVEVELAY